jgi:hypothetical protein
MRILVCLAPDHEPSCRDVSLLSSRPFLDHFLLHHLLLLILILILILETIIVIIIIMSFSKVCI